MPGNTAFCNVISLLNNSPATFKFPNTVCVDAADTNAFETLKSSNISKDISSFRTAASANTTVEPSTAVKSVMLDNLTPF